MSFRTGLSILRESWNVLKQDAELLWFPVMSGVAVVLILATVVGAGLFLPPVGEWALEVFDGFADENVAFSIQQVLGLVVMFAIYAVEYFVVIYFNTALVSCALMRYEGGDPTVSDGLRMANQRMRQILGWTLLSAGVGTALSAIESRLEFVGKFIVRLVGVAWAIATYFVVPILAAEGLGPVDAVKRSAQLLRKTWGEGLVGNLALGLVTGTLIAMVVLGLAGALTLAIVYDSVPLVIAAAVVLIVMLVISLVINSTLHQIFLAGLYRYATTGEVTPGFSASSFEQAFKTKK